MRLRLRLWLRPRLPVPVPPVVYEDDDLLAFDKPSGLLVALALKHLRRHG